MQDDLNEVDAYFKLSNSDIQNIGGGYPARSRRGSRNSCRQSECTDCAKLLGKVSEANRQINLEQHASAITSKIWVLNVKTIKNFYFSQPCIQQFKL